MFPNEHARPATDQHPGQPGIFAGGANILRELLKTPRVTNSVRILLSHLDPENAKELVRTLMFQDSALFLDLICSVPALGNALMHGTGEIFERVLDMPRELLDALLPRLLDDLDAEQCGRAVGLGLHAIANMFGHNNPRLAEAAQSFSNKASRGLHQTLDAYGYVDEPKRSELGLIARLVGLVGRAAAKDGSRLQLGMVSLSAGLRQVLEANPEFVQHVIQPLVNAVHESMAGVHQ